LVWTIIPLTSKKRYQWNGLLNGGWRSPSRMMHRQARKTRPMLIWPFLTSMFPTIPSREGAWSNGDRCQPMRWCVGRSHQPTTSMRSWPDAKLQALLT